MLFTQTVSKELLELLKHLMNVDCLKKFDLVGGTSLALQIGHRNSIDIDLFGESQIEEEDFLSILNTFGKVITIKKSSHLLVASVNNIKVDIVNYKYPVLEKSTMIDGIRFASKQDIAAMKLNAIAGRGSKKDFIDLYFLLSLYSLEEMINFYQRKYYDGSVFLVLKSLTYFDDADIEVEPLMHVPFSWEACKDTIRNHVRNYLHR